MKVAPSPRRVIAQTAATGIALLAALIPSSGRAAIAGSDGVYVDGSGAKQPWRITAAHTLMWGDKAFVPVGGLFQARSWTPGATDADWENDKQALKLLKAHQVTDVYLQPPHGIGLTDVSPAAIQRLIDLLETEGFTYGISIADGPRESLDGYVVRPAVYRQLVSNSAPSVSFAAPGVDSYLYFVVTLNGLDVVKDGEGKPDDGMATLALHSLPGDYAAFLIPKKSFPVTSSGSSIGYPNLWDGFDNYRDTLLALLRGVHLGHGFRFFVDPLPADLTNLDMEADRLIPTGIGFRTEWSAYLGRRYKNLAAVEGAWGVLDRDAKTIEQAAQFVPLWSGGKGIEYFYDQTTGQRIRVDTQRSNYWKDLTGFKTQSIQRYMNDLSTILKRAVADVPVVYRSSGVSGSSPLLSNLPVDGGFDGIGITAYGHGEELIRKSAGYVYAQAMESPRTMWLPVIETADASPAEKTGIGYASKPSMHSDFDYLREIGARGFYVDGVHLTDLARHNFDLSAVPEQLDWLADYERLLVATGVRPADGPTLFYPKGISSLTPRPLPGGGWWLPTDRPSVTYDLGPLGRAYGLVEDGQAVYYLFRPNGGPRKIELKIPKASMPNGSKPVVWLPRAAGEMHKDTLSLTIGPDPVRLLNLANLPIPTETFDELYVEAAALIHLMKQRNILEMGRFEQELAQIKILYNKDQPYRSIQQLEELLQHMRSFVQPYAWYEAESDRNHSFDEQINRVGASGGHALRVDTRAPNAPPALVSFDVVGQGSAVEVWAAASPDAPLTFRLDGQPLLDQAFVPKRVGMPYADGTLVWTYFGTATIPQGRHKIQVRASGPATLDVVLLTPPHSFTPDGINPPPVMP